MLNTDSFRPPIILYYFNFSSNCSQKSHWYMFIWELGVFVPPKVCQMISIWKLQNMITIKIFLVGCKPSCYCCPKPFFMSNFNTSLLINLIIFIHFQLTLFRYISWNLFITKVFQLFYSNLQQWYKVKHHGSCLIFL